MGALFAAGLVAQPQAPPKTHLKEGDMAPDFTLPSTTGKPVKLSDFRGKNTVVLASTPPRLPVAEPRNSPRTRLVSQNLTQPKQKYLASAPTTSLPSGNSPRKSKPTFPC